MQRSSKVAPHHADVNAEPSAHLFDVVSMCAGAGDGHCVVVVDGALDSTSAVASCAMIG
jgi:hypothetical protein